MFIAASLSLINLAMLSAGLFMANKVHMEEEEILKYKRISELQFCLLNKKIEAMGGQVNRV